LGDRATALRVGLLVGAGDYMDRLTWWVRRIDQARDERQQIPAPGPTDRAIQLIDVRDAANFALLCAEKEYGHIWNVVGRTMALENLLSDITRVCESPAEFVWVSEQSLVNAGIEPWTEMPLMCPVSPDYKHLLDVDTDRAHQAGLRCRPIEETLDSLVEWDRTRRHEALKCGVTPEQELLLLA